MKIQEYIERLLAHSGVNEATVEVTEPAEHKMVVQINVPESESGALIGHHGETLAALQRIVNIVFREELADTRVTININDYRDRRTEALQAQTIRNAHQVLKTGRSYTFDYLPSNERYIVHATLTENEEFSELESVSDGEGKQRLLSIRKKANTA